MNFSHYPRQLNLPSPQTYLGNKRTSIRQECIRIENEIIATQLKLYALSDEKRSLESDYQIIDFKLARVDGRLKKVTPKKEYTAKTEDTKTKDKVVSVTYTPNQIAAIANALGIEL